MKAIITGITGQDGSYLTELLLNKNIEVIGLTRRASTDNTQRIKDLLPHINLRQIDLCDAHSLIKIVKDVQPDYFFNLGAMSHVHTSFDQPGYTTQATYLGCLNSLEALKEYKPDCRFYQANSSEMFGDSLEEDNSQNETTRFNPRSPYAIAKLASHHLVDIYRQSYNMFAVSGILFNHTSPRRGLDFVESKILHWAKYYQQYKQPIHLGNLSAYRDFGFAGDYVEAMWLITNNEKPKDYVVATGQTNQIQEILDFAISKNPELSNHVIIDPKLFRPCEVPYLKGDATLIKEELGWLPNMNFESLMQHIWLNI